MIKVCNKHYHIDDPSKDIDIYRPSIFGSHWSPMESDFEGAIKTSTRKEAVNKYLPYFLDKYKNNADFKEVVDGLVEIHRSGKDINLVCWCVDSFVKESECHGYIIKSFIEYKAKNMK